MNKSSKKYFAVGLNDNLTNKRIAGEIYFENNSLVFQTEDDKIIIPFQGIISKRGGAGNNLIFFENSSLPDWSIYTSDKSILKDKSIRDNSSFASLNSNRKKELIIISSILIIISLIITSFIYGFYFFKETVTFFIASQVPFTWEKKLGNTIFKSITQGKKIYKDKADIQLLDPIIQPLILACKDTGYDFEIYIMDDNRVNAFALPGGIIIIHTELLKKAETPEQIAGVLAHEISHVTEKHGVRQLINSVGIFLVVQTLLGDISGLLAILTQNSGILLASKFSRDYEREADAKGFNILINSNIDPKGMVDFFKKIQEIENSEKGLESESWFQFISTHPGTEERIESLEKEIELVKSRKFKKIIIDLKSIQKKY